MIAIKKIPISKNFIRLLRLLLLALHFDIFEIVFRLNPHKLAYLHPTHVEVQSTVSKSEPFFSFPISYLSSISFVVSFQWSFNQSFVRCIIIIHFINTNKHKNTIISIVKKFKFLLFQCWNGCVGRFIWFFQFQFRIIAFKRTNIDLFILLFNRESEKEFNSTKTLLKSVTFVLSLWQMMMHFALYLFPKGKHI